MTRSKRKEPRWGSKRWLEKILKQQELARKREDKRRAFFAGRIGLLSPVPWNDPMRIRVKVVDVRDNIIRRSGGARPGLGVQFLVEPLSGTGRTWVDAARLREYPRWRTEWNRKKSSASR